MRNKKLDKNDKPYNSKALDEILDQLDPNEQKLISRKMKLAARIYDAMKAKGWNQSQFAKEMGKHNSEISKWLSGTHNFNAETLWEIGDVLGVDLLPVGLENTVEVIKYIPVIVKAEPLEEAHNKGRDFYSEYFKKENFISLSKYNQTAIKAVSN